MVNYLSLIRIVFLNLIIWSLFISVYADDNLSVIQLSKLDNEKLKEVYISRGIIKINFYHWDRETNEKREFVGSAELKEGKLTYDISDMRLEKMLKGNFHTMVTIEENGRQINKFVSYKVGTIKHLQSVIDHCKDISCIAEMLGK